MLKEFIKQCMFFRTKDKVNIFLGVFVWINLLHIILQIYCLSLTFI